MRNFLSYINSVFEEAWEVLDLACSNNLESLAINRIIICSFVLLFFTPHFGWIGDIPKEFFNPPTLSIANLFNGFPSTQLFKLIDIIIVALLIFITIGIKCRISGIILFLLIIFGNSFRYSFGKIDHGILPWIVIFLMSFSGWGEKYSLFPDSKSTSGKNNRILSIIGIMICFGFFSAGFPKLIYWIDFDLKTSGILSWYYRSYYTLDRTFLLAPYFSSLPFWFLEILDYTAALFEVSGFIFLLLGAFYWRIWLFIAAIFHLTNTLLLNIPFILHIPVYLIYINTSRFLISTERKELFKFFSFKIICFIPLLIISTTEIIMRINEQGSNSLLIDFISNFYFNEQVIKLYISTFLWFFIVVVIFSEVIYYYRKIDIKA